MNWAFSKPHASRSDLDVATSGTQTSDIPEIKSETDDHKISRMNIDEEECAVSANEATTELEEIIDSLPSSSKQTFAADEIPNECSGI